MRKDPKKPVVQAAQMVCLVRESQSEFAILSPKVSRMGRVTTRRLLCFGLFCVERCVAPFMRMGNRMSSVMWAEDFPWMWWMNFRAEMYALMVEGASFLVKWHQITKDRMVSIGIGYVAHAQRDASKQANALYPDLYFPHVDLAKAEFTRAEKLSCSVGEGLSRDVKGSGSACRKDRVDALYLSR